MTWGFGAATVQGDRPGSGWRCVVCGADHGGMLYFPLVGWSCGPCAESVELIYVATENLRLPATGDRPAAAGAPERRS